LPFQGSTERHIPKRQATSFRPVVFLGPSLRGFLTVPAACARFFDGGCPNSRPLKAYGPDRACRIARGRRHARQTGAAPRAVKKSCSKRLRDFTKIPGGTEGGTFGEAFNKEHLNSDVRRFGSFIAAALVCANGPPIGRLRNGRERKGPASLRHPFGPTPPSVIPRQARSKTSRFPSFEVQIV